MRLAESIETMAIDTVRTADGCPEACLHCGAYDGLFKKDDLRIVEVGPEQLRANLSAIIQGTKFKIADLLAKFVTTDVNTEPLRGEAFVSLAKLVEELTRDRAPEMGGQSRVACISHGLKVDSKGVPLKVMEKNLKKIVDLMMNVEPGVRDVPTVPVFVLSVDAARERGNIDFMKNAQSYLATMQILRPVLSYPDARLTISIQGVNDENHPLYKGTADLVFQSVLNELRLSPTERAALHWDRGRNYANVGRASFIPNLDQGACPVIPDQDLVDQIPVTKIYRGKVDGFGRVWRQPNHPHRTYNDTVSGKWELLDNENGGSGNKLDKPTVEIAKNGGDSLNNLAATSKRVPETVSRYGQVDGKNTTDSSGASSKKGGQKRKAA